jgi:hypothetical protein
MSKTIGGKNDRRRIHTHDLDRMCGPISSRFGSQSFEGKLNS